MKGLYILNLRSWWFASPWIGAKVLKQNVEFIITIISCLFFLGFKIWMLTLGKSMFL